MSYQPVDPDRYSELTFLFHKQETIEQIDASSALYRMLDYSTPDILHARKVREREILAAEDKRRRELG